MKSFISKAALLGGFSFGAILLSGAGSAFADTQTFTGSFGPATTNYTNQPLSPAIPQFDLSMGVLTNITFTLTGSVSGSDRQESLDNSATTVTSSLTATISLQLNSGTVLATVVPTQTFTDNFTPFDGTIDFGGTSGATHLNISASQATNGTVSPTNFPSFIGAGTVPLGISASGNSTANGAGNLISQFLTSGAGSATIVYTFTPVPEPASFALVGGGLGLLAFTLRGRRQRA